ncbi:retrovirus-related pol polyprotein from transposon TNT 1-94 [Tanacetum coccineum]
MTKGRSKEAETIKTVKVIENTLDAATRIILLENVQSHREARTKELSSEVLGAITTWTEEDDDKIKDETCLVAQAPNENEKLKEEALKLTKFEKSTHCLNEMLSNQKPSGDKLGLGFNSFEASSSGTKEIKFVKAQKKASSDGGLINMGGPLSIQAVPKEIIRPPPAATLGSEKSRGIRKKGLYVMKLGNKPEDKICLATIDENSMFWHRRLGHANMHLIQSLASKELVRNLPKFKFDQHFCDACKIRKQAHASHKAKNIVSTTRCLELLHMDHFGPSAIRSYGGNRYTLVIVDDYSMYT